MLKPVVVASVFILSLAALVIPSEASTKAEVLYVAGPQQSSNVMLYTYSVDPTTATATPVGNAINVASGSIVPLSIGTSHYLYLWNKTGVWLYPTDADGAPLGTPAQHVRFSFPHPVNTFLIDPDGKFAYAALGWLDSQGNETLIVLFTIDQTTGELTDTNEVVASYTNNYTGFVNFQFAQRGDKLFGLYSDNGPYTSAIGYDYYPVNQATGGLGTLQTMFYAQTYECGSSCAVAVTDLLSANDGLCCGPTSGEIAVTLTSSNGATQAFCPSSGDSGVCTDDVASLVIDPANKNVFFGDKTAGETFILNVDFAAGQLNPTSDSILGTPPIYFSPDSRLVYTVNQSDIGIYALQTATGALTASSILPHSGKVSIATASLEE
jgi:6-phosphogluconolactonase (cycloisomerase 2 family)